MRIKLQTSRALTSYAAVSMFFFTGFYTHSDSQVLGVAYLAMISLLHLFCTKLSKIVVYNQWACRFCPRILVSPCWWKDKNGCAWIATLTVRGTASRKTHLERTSWTREKIVRDEGQGERHSIVCCPSTKKRLDKRLSNNRDKERYAKGIKRIEDTTEKNKRKKR